MYNLRNHFFEYSGVPTEQLLSRLSRFLSDARSHDHDLAPFQICVVAGGHFHRLTEWDGMIDVVGFSYRAILIQIYENYFSPNTLNRHCVCSRRADHTRTNDANLRPGIFALLLQAKQRATRCRAPQHLPRATTNKMTRCQHQLVSVFFSSLLCGREATSGPGRLRNQIQYEVAFASLFRNR